jgi:predicted transposase YbfD/YdcC
MAQRPLIDYLKNLPDSRHEEKCTYILSEVVFMAICAIFSNQDTWEQVALYSKERESWFKRWFELPYGTPSHDTFNRIFSLLAPEALRSVFSEWVQDFLGDSGIRGQVAIDGKAVRGAAKGKGGKTIHMVNAWASDLGLCLGQLKVDDKSNEITAIPELLKLLDLKGCLVSIDAMGTQKKIAEAITTKEADFFLPAKGNQKKLTEEIEDQFNTYWEQHPIDEESELFTETHDNAHGRQEQRRCWILPVSDETPVSNSWGAKCLIAVQSDRGEKQKSHSSVKFYICSRKITVKEALSASRKHWAVENLLHWSLDVSFGEDGCRTRQGFSGENLAVIRQLVLNILKQNTSRKLSMKNKRTLCVLNNDYLLECMAMVK